MKTFCLRVVCVALIASAGTQLHAVEGGIETYLLGSRDSFAGILPLPGTYFNNDFVSFSAQAPSFSAGGVTVSDPDIDVFTYKLNLTHVFDAKWGSARLGLNINLPYVSADGDYSGELTSGFSGTLTDTGENNFGDLTVTPLLNWSKGNVHTMLALQFFLPTGHYETTQVDGAARSVDALNASKNRFAFDPTVSRTWFDPVTGWEFSGALGVTISAENNATDYQTAPEAHFEGTVMRHLPNKLAFGVTGYAYHQIGDDSGSGADALRATLDSDSLQARVFGLGPIVTWNTQVGEVPVSLKAKYTKEFGAKRRFESDKLWLTLGLAF